MLKCQGQLPPSLDVEELCLLTCKHQHSSEKTHCVVKQNFMYVCQDNYISSWLLHTSEQMHFYTHAPHAVYRHKQLKGPQMVNITHRKFIVYSLFIAVGPLLTLLYEA